MEGPVHRAEGPDRLPGARRRVVHLGSAGSGLVWATRLGGGNVDAGTGVALHPSGRVYVVPVPFRRADRRSIRTQPAERSGDQSDGGGIPMVSPIGLVAAALASWRLP